MQKLSNFTGQARQSWDRMTPSFGRPHDAHPHPPPPHPPTPHQHPSHAPPGGPPGGKRGPLGGVNAAAAGAPPPSPLTTAESAVNLSFNVPFAATLAGPDPADVLHASPGAFHKWTHPPPAGEDAAALPPPPTHKLPVHTKNVEYLRHLCKGLSEASGGRLEAAVTSSEPKPTPAAQRLPRKGLITNVCVSGEADVVHKMRVKILSDTPIALRCAVVDVDTEFVADPASGIKPGVLEHLNIIAKFTGCDIFLLNSKQADPDDLSSNYVNGTDQTLEQRLRIAIYGDPESSEHAKMRVLIMIDQILKRTVDMMKLELSLHNIICGRTRKNIRYIEAATNTAIYFPPPFPGVYGYLPPGAQKRGEDEIYITGHSQENISQAKKKLHELVMNTKCFVKEVTVSPHKIDCIILDRLDKVRRVMEVNGSYVLFPPLGSQRNTIRVQGTEILHVERTVREIMALAGQFYSATWWIIQPDPAQAHSRPPSPADIRAMLSDICTNSGADLAFEKFSFTINGSDDAVKAAMVVIQQIPFVNRAQYQMRVKIELANEHKEFVSGKKNGKINKIMGQSNVQIIFDGFNEYNFYIDVCGGQYDATRNGLDLVEQEMPASISFHVPDQYHKRIIGIGGQHIQRIMKKYSVFVKFSNAMDRGGIGKEDEDIKVDNVICRTPARNAQSLDLVKQEIMDMVEKADAEFVSETVVINRLYHRELIARMPKIEELEKKWNCKIDFPATEMASDVVTISGPEYQVPQARDEFLGMVPEQHEIVFPGTPQLRSFFKTDDFERDVRRTLQAQYEVDVSVRDGSVLLDAATDTTEERLVLSYTRNNAGGLKDAIDFLVSRFVPYGLDATTVQGAIPRPKSDSFEDSLPFFDSKILQIAPAPLTAAGTGGSTDSPTRASFSQLSLASTPTAVGTPGSAPVGPSGSGGDDAASDRGSLFAKLRKPGSITSLSSFLDRRKNNHSSSSTSLFKHASSNASKASLVSMESRDSGYRNPWNDSGVNLPDLGAGAGPHAHPYGGIYQHHHHGSGGSAASLNGWPPATAAGPPGMRFPDRKSSFSASLTGDATPRHHDGLPPGAAPGVPSPMRARPSFSESQSRPQTGHSSLNGYPAPIGTPR